MTKTYEHRLSDLAAEMAKEMWDSTYSTDFDYVPDNVQPLKEWAIENHKPLAAIALKHMAEAYKEGYDYGFDNAQFGAKPNVDNIIKTLGYGNEA